MIKLLFLRGFYEIMFRTPVLNEAGIDLTERGDYLEQDVILRACTPVCILDYDWFTHTSFTTVIYQTAIRRSRK
jgi:hypothetical protein